MNKIEKYFIRCTESIKEESNTRELILRVEQLTRQARGVVRDYLIIDLQIYALNRAIEDFRR